MSQAMGAAAARRARELFAPEVVMAAHEDLFGELSSFVVRPRCQLPQAGQSSDRPCARFCELCIPSFFRHWSHNCFDTNFARGSEAARAPIWQILEQSLPVSARSRLEIDLVSKHQQKWPVKQAAVQYPLPFLTRFRPC